jgi:hypothetical protein
VTSHDTRLNAVRFPLYPHEAETTHPIAGQVGSFRPMRAIAAHGVMLARKS